MFVQVRPAQRRFSFQELRPSLLWDSQISILKYIHISLFIIGLTAYDAATL